MELRLTTSKPRNCLHHLQVNDQSCILPGVTNLLPPLLEAPSAGSIQPLVSCVHTENTREECALFHLFWTTKKQNHFMFTSHSKQALKCNKFIQTTLFFYCITMSKVNAVLFPFPPLKRFPKSSNTKIFDFVRNRSHFLKITSITNSSISVSALRWL